MTVSDENILLASSPIVGFVTLEYFIYAALTGVKDGNRNLSIPSMRATLKKNIEDAAEQIRINSFEKIPVQKTSQVRSDVDLRQDARTRFVRDKILDAYISKFGIDLPDNFKPLERSELSDMLYMANLKGKFKGTAAEDLVRQIEGNIRVRDEEAETRYITVNSEGVLSVRDENTGADYITRDVQGKFRIRGREVAPRDMDANGNFKVGEAGTANEFLIKETSESISFVNVMTGYEYKIGDSDGMMTVNDYVVRETKRLTQKMVDDVVRLTVNHRKECITKSPGFKLVLANADLDIYRKNAGLNAGGSDDVIENINFQILKRIQTEFAEELSETIDIDSVMAVISVLQDLVVTACTQKIRLSGQQLRSSGYDLDIYEGVNVVYLDLTPANAKKVLDLAFPMCDNVAYSNSYIPDGVFERFYAHERYRAPRKQGGDDDFLPVFWVVFLKYYAVYGLRKDEILQKSVVAPQLVSIAAKVVDFIVRKGERREFTADQSMKLLLKNSSSIVMYSHSQCQYCKSARALLDREGLLERTTVINKDSVDEIPPNNRSVQTFPFFIVTDRSGNKTQVNTWTDLNRILNTSIRATIQKS